MAAAPDEGERFQRRYLVADHSSVLSGLPEGLHYFKVRGLDAEGIPGVWSLPLEVEVSYMDAARVRLLMILGGLVVLITAAAILHGHFTHRGKEAKR